MATSRETGFGSKLNNAKTMFTYLQTFLNYQPLQEQDSLKFLEQNISNLSELYDLEASKEQSYTLSVDIRQKLLKTDNDSLTKLITFINGYVKAKYDKNSKEAITINEQIIKIRGSKNSKPKDDTDEKSVSTSQLSYGSVTQAFSNLIISLETLKPSYSPPNETISLSNLKTKLNTIQQATVQINTMIGELAKLRNQRDTQYSVLKESCLRIKEAVKSQYGNSSVEYSLVKGLKF